MKPENVLLKQQGRSGIKVRQSPVFDGQNYIDLCFEKRVEYNN